MVRAKNCFPHGIAKPEPPRRVAQRLDQAVHAGNRPDRRTLGVAVLEMVEIVGKTPELFSNLVRGVQSAVLRIGQHGYRTGLARGEVATQEPCALDARTVAAQLAEQIVGHVHQQPVVEQGRHHDQAAHEDQSGTGEDHLAQPLPEAMHNRTIGSPVIRHQAHVRQTADAKRPEDDRPRRAEHGRRQRQASQQGYNQTQRDRRTAVAELAELATGDGASAREWPSWRIAATAPPTWPKECATAPAVSRPLSRSSR